MQTLKQLRNYTGLNQAKFSHIVGLPLTTYCELERGITKTREVHLNAARWAVLRITGVELRPEADLSEYDDMKYKAEKYDIEHLVPLE